MEYKLPDLPVRHEVVGGLWEEVRGPYDAEEMRQYAEQAVAPLLADIEHLKDRVAFWQKCFDEVTK